MKRSKVKLPSNTRKVAKVKDNIVKKSMKSRSVRSPEVSPIDAFDDIQQNMPPWGFAEDSIVPCTPAAATGELHRGNDSNCQRDESEDTLRMDNFWKNEALSLQKQIIHLRSVDSMIIFVIFMIGLFVGYSLK